MKHKSMQAVWDFPTKVPQDADESWDMTGRSVLAKSLKPANLTYLNTVSMPR